MLCIEKTVRGLVLQILLSEDSYGGKKVWLMVVVLVLEARLLLRDELNVTRKNFAKK